MAFVPAKPRFQLGDVRVVGVDLAPRIGDLPVMRLARLVDLPEPRCFAAAMAGLRFVEYSPGCLAGSLIMLLAAEHALERSRRFRLEVRPPRSRGGNREPAQFQRRDLDAAAQRREADPGISRQRRLQQALQLCDLMLNRGCLDGGIFISGRRLRYTLLALTCLTLLFCDTLRRLYYLPPIRASRT
jgi:hypothetical protein